MNVIDRLLVKESNVWTEPLPESIRTNRNRALVLDTKDRLSLTSARTESIPAMVFAANDHSSTGAPTCKR